MKKLILFFLVVFACISSSFGQIISSQYLVFFKIEKLGSHINTQWRTGVDFTCNDVDLYFGTDSNNLSRIYSYPGVCGGPAVELDYNYIHENPEKGMLYYQLRLGVFGNSAIQKLNNPNLNNGYIVYPNPVVKKATIEINNPKSQTVDFVFYDITGKELSIKKSTSINFLEVSKEELGLSGLVIFTATNKTTGRSVRGKFSVL